MNKQGFLQNLNKLDEQFASFNKITYAIPKYTPENHYIDIAQSDYFKILTVLRHVVKSVSDFYWSNIVGAYNVDLFMMTPSVSSPMGPGSDSEAVEIQFGNLRTYLVDSSQFGFEPILMNGFDALYCYLPSMRGEHSDKRHLNQFYHCEAEIKGTLEDLQPKIEGYIKFLSETLLTMPNILRLLSKDIGNTKTFLKEILNKEVFKTIEFDDAVQLLIDNGYNNLIDKTEFGTDITNDGELKIMELLGMKTPLWVKHYDRDRVAFYQKPQDDNKNKVINADLLLPPLLDGAFGGEVAGCGQRQDNYDEMLESLKRQKIDSKQYEWYMNLRKLPHYTITSGFGLGIERFITWAIGHDDIRDVILYPRLKNVHTCP